MEWIKVYTSKWLYGSGRTMTPEKRGVWMDLLSLAGETKFRDGSLRFEVNEPMSRDYISALLRIDRELLDICLIAFQADVNIDDSIPRIQIWGDGTIFLTNFESYQSVPEGKGKEKLTGRELELYQRAQLNKLAEKFPIEALNVAAVKRIRQGELDDKDTT